MDEGPQGAPLPGYGSGPAWPAQPAPQPGAQPAHPWLQPPAQPWGYPAPPWVHPAQLKAPPGEHPDTLPWRLAGWWSRAGAQLIDLLIVWIPGMVVVAAPLLVAVAQDEGSAARYAWFGVSIVAILLVLFAHYLYAPLLMKRSGRRNGQTFGKQACGIRVIRADGRPLRFGDAALRQIVFKGFGGLLVNTLLPLVPWLLNYLWPTWDEQHRALHDMAANTRVVAA